MRRRRDDRTKARDEGGIQSNTESHGRFRMDAVILAAEFDDTTQTATFALIPDPKRYERRVIRGTEGWYDRFDHTFMPEAVFRDMVAQMPGSPIYWQRPRIENSFVYARERRAEFARRLTEPDAPRPAIDQGAQVLEAVGPREYGFAILIVDLVGSTTLSQELAAGEYARVIAAVVSELSEVVPSFLGHVLKYTGDGLIAFFPEPSFNRMNDMAIDCALTMRALMVETINPALAAEGWAALDVRIGLESGDAFITVIGTPESKLQHDIIGEIVNLAAKIQAIGKPGDILVGGSMDRSLHTDWRIHLEPYPPDPNWSYQRRDGSPYPVYRVVAEAVPRDTQIRTGPPRAR